jgi:hypothetical protein
MPRWVGIIPILVTTCGSYSNYIKEHQAQLEAAFPPGKVTREEVHSRMSGADAAAQPNRTDVRPASGWPDNGASRCERRLGTRVATAEAWMNPCGGLSSLTLCHYWFYYDEAGVLACVSGWQSD